MDKKKIDLSDIKEVDLDKTSSFTDLMSRTERRNRKIEKDESENDDIVAMVDERKKSTKDLEKNEKKDEELGSTQILELTKQMKFNFEETKKENNKKKKNGVSTLNVIGEINVLCIGYYIYLLVFTSYEGNEMNYFITGGLIVLLVLLFGLSVVTNKKISNFFKVLNVLVIIIFIAFNVYTLLY